MEYQVSISDRAGRDLILIYANINAEHSLSALKWYETLKRSILSLKKHPHRCPIIRKRHELRHLLFGHKPHVYRVIFRVSEKQKSVVVLHIRHAARRKPKLADLT